MVEKFEHIEKTYPVEKIIINNDYIWGYLRTSYFWKIFEDNSIQQQDYIKSKKKTFFQFSIFAISQSLYGLRNWFRSYEYIFFCDSDAKICIDGLWREKRFSRLIHYLQSDKCLYVENPISKHKAKDKIDIQYIVSKNIIKLIGFISLKFTKKSNLTIDVLDKINNNEQVILDYNILITRFNLSVKIYTILFKIYKPKIIFVSCYESDQAILKAAHILGIKTVEMQHGVIGRKHFAYNMDKKFDVSFFPDELLTFGQYDKNIICNKPFSPYKQVHVVGSYALELLNSIPISKRLKALTEKYTKTISVSTQYTVEEKLAEYLKYFAKENENIGIFFSLRHYDKEYYKKYNFPDNIHLFYEDISCYEILNACDIHVTGNSTCGVEALTFKKVSIMIDFDNITKEYYDDIINNNLYIVDERVNLLDYVYLQYKVALPVYFSDHSIRTKKIIEDGII